MDDDVKRLIQNSAAETRRHFDTVAERLDQKVQLLAEGLLHVDEKINRVDTKVDALDGKINRVDTKVDALDSKMTRGFADVQAMIKFSHEELDRRL
ncbi:MAG TPA: hypothetical protein VF975_00740 [Thermoanaerobaculia bacterium]